MGQFDDKQKERIVHLIETLLVEPKIRESVTRDFVPHKKEYKHVLIVIERSKIYFAKYHWGGFGTFANNLIKCYEEVSFSDFFIKTWDALVDRFFDVCRHLTNDGYWKTIGTKTDLDNQEQSSHHIKGCPYSGGVEIQVGTPKAPPTLWRVVDSVGQTFEVLSARWVGGAE